MISLFLFSWIALSWERSVFSVQLSFYSFPLRISLGLLVGNCCYWVSYWLLATSARNFGSAKVSPCCIARSNLCTIPPLSDSLSLGLPTRLCGRYNSLRALSAVTFARSPYHSATSLTVKSIPTVAAFLSVSDSADNPLPLWKFSRLILYSQFRFSFPRWFSHIKGTFHFFPSVSLSKVLYNYPWMQDILCSFWFTSPKHSSSISTKSLPSVSAAAKSRLLYLWTVCLASTFRTSSTFQHSYARIAPTFIQFDRVS